MCAKDGTKSIAGSIAGTVPLLTLYTAHYRFIVTFRDRSRKSSFAILPNRISKPGQESAPQEVRVNHIIEHEMGDGVPIGNSFADRVIRIP